MKRSFREQLIAVVTFLAGIYFFFEFVLPKTVAGYQFGKYHQEISNGFVVVGSMALGLGLINLLTVHGIAILKTRKGWPYSAALLLGLGVMMYFEIAAFVQSQKGVTRWAEIAQLSAYEQRIVDEKEKRPVEPRIKAALSRLDEIIADAANPHELLYVANSENRSVFVDSLEKVKSAFIELETSLDNNTEEKTSSRTVVVAEAVAKARGLAKDIVDQKIENSFYKLGATFLYKSFFVPLGAAMFSLLAFYVASAAYRTFRVRSAEAGIMMSAAIIVMLGQIPHGPIYISPNLVPIRLWLLEQLSTPAFRAIFFGSAIAGLAMAVRMWLSLERSPLDSED